MNYNWLGFVVVFVFSLLFASAGVATQFTKRFRQLFILGFFVHVFGTLVRYGVLYGYYDGGDAGRYYFYGLKYARMIWAGNFSIFDPIHMELPRWWGTQTTMWIAGFILTCIGPSKLGGFLFFSMIAFGSIALFSKAFEKNFPNSSLKKYATWLLFWPSLWFWPSSIGKDALVLLATALVVYGYTRKREAIKWGTLVAGLILVAVIRPQVAGILVVSVGVAHWISPGKRWGTVHYVQGFLLLVILGLVVRYGLTSVGIDEFDLDDFQGYVETISEQSAEGESVIEAPGLTVWGAPLAIVNILFRPFPWEATNPMAAAACLEMGFFWAMVIVRRHRIIALVAQWRSHKLLRLGVPLTFLYIIALGMAAGNLGIIARQRIHVMPLLFIWLEAIPVQLQPKKKRFARPTEMRIPIPPPANATIQIKRD
jgi:hypothetical protein